MPMRELTPLGLLIQAREDQTAWSQRRIAKEAGISKTTIGNLKWGPVVNMPDTATLRRLAGALAVPEVVVVDAALATVGLARPRGGAVPDVEEAIDSQPDLGEKEREALKAFIRGLRRGA